MAFPDRIALVGYRGSGKTTIGRALAAAISYDFADTDAGIEQQQGKSIRAIFDEDGEAHFRRLEEQLITQLLQRPRLVISLGGGAILSADTRRRLAESCRVIWLKAPVSILAARLQSDPSSCDQRPPLTPTGTVNEISEVLQQRLPLYEQVAHHTLDSSVCSVDELVAEIVRLLSSSRAV